MNIEINKKNTQEFNKHWKKLTDGSAYLIPETIDDFKSLGPFPYFHLENIQVFPKDHTFDIIHHLTNLIFDIVGNEFFSWPTIYDAIRNEIKIYFTTQQKQTNDWHLTHLVNSIFSKKKKRLFIRSISGLKIEGFDGIFRNNWQIIPFTENEIAKFSEQESVNNQWESHVKKYLAKNYKNKICLFVETEGDFETAKKSAHNIASFVINTLRYFICIHISHTESVHDVGIKLDDPNDDQALNAFSFDLESKESTMFGYGDKFRHEYHFRKENFDIMKSDWNAEMLWDLKEKNELNDLEASIMSSITWLGDAHQEKDVNSSYVKYWIAIEALLTGHKKNDLTTRIKNTIPIMISQFSQNFPTKTEVDKAYELRCKVVHCGAEDIVKLNDLNRVCKWATQCLSACTHLCSKGYISRDQIEFEINRMNKAKQNNPSKEAT